MHRYVRCTMYPAIINTQTPFKAPEVQLDDEEELEDYRLKKRKEFEDTLHRQRQNMSIWFRYAKWEATQKQFERARSIYERALEIDHRSVSLWLKYAEMEMKNKYINYARNVWDRACTLMPRVDQFWYKYAHMEEMMGNVAGARQVFERWMEWEPEPAGWNSYVKLELRHGNLDQARSVFERWAIVHSDVKTFVKYADFENKYGHTDKARAVYDRALAVLDFDGNETEDMHQLFLKFAEFEVSHSEIERARVVYKYALDHVTKDQAEEIYKIYTSFEKQHGDREGVETVILSKRRFEYEDQLEANPLNYDAWFDYIRLEESKNNVERTREVYERAIGHIPPVAEKKYWRRYIYLWINYALHEELIAKDMQRCRLVYEKCMQLVPHETFTFAKLWMMLAHFEIRQNNLEGARRVLGTAIGKCPKEKVFKGYIALEQQLGNIDRCRKLYEKYLEFAPENVSAWTAFAELEASLSEEDRARGVYQLAVAQPVIDMPEVLWKAYIDFEIKMKNYKNVRKLYDTLLERTQHVKIYISRAQFEASVKKPELARQTFEAAHAELKSKCNMNSALMSDDDGEKARLLVVKQDRVLLLEAWKDFEKNFGSAEQIAAVKALLPNKVKKKRKIPTDDGSDIGWEEYYDYIFPEDQTRGSGNLKLLAMARAWKKQKK